MSNYLEHNGIIYEEIDLIEIKNKKYAYLVNENDEKDFMIKIVDETNNEYVNLKDKNEFELALMYFLKKHKDIIK